eukprot:5768130-Prymnesium_polylepis.1
MTSRGGRRSERGTVADVCDNARALVDGNVICTCAHAAWIIVTKAEYCAIGSLWGRPLGCSGPHGPLIFTSAPKSYSNPKVH